MGKWALNWSEPLFEYPTSVLVPTSSTFSARPGHSLCLGLWYVRFQLSDFHLPSFTALLSFPTSPASSQMLQNTKPVVYQTQRTTFDTFSDNYLSVHLVTYHFLAGAGGLRVQALDFHVKKTNKPKVALQKLVVFISMHRLYIRWTLTSSSMPSALYIHNPSSSLHLWSNTNILPLIFHLQTSFYLPNSLPLPSISVFL